MKARAAVPGLALLVTLTVTAPARAQDELELAASIQMLSQSPWTTPDDPLLKILIRVRNDGTSSIDAPEVGWSLGPRIGARDQYEAALIDGPAVVSAADTVFLQDDLAPGDAEEVPLELDTGEITAIDAEDSGVYPLQLELRSAGTRIAAVTTAAIHIAQRPQKPVSFSWWTEIDAPVAFAPDGRLIDPRFEAALEAEEGIAAQVDAIADLVAEEDRVSDTVHPMAVDLVVSPAALDQLQQAADGYLRADGSRIADVEPPAVVAGETLRQLREIAASPQVRLYATPFAAPRLPSLLSSVVLQPHLTDQWRLGDETFERLLGEPPAAKVARPTGLAVDQASVDILADRGVTTILGAADSVERPTDPLDLAPPPAAEISTTSGTDVDIVLPDPSTQALLTDRDLWQDPVRAAQAVLGELATIWREQPVPPEPDVRGLALDVPRDLPAAMWGPLVRRLTRAPFLLPVHAQDLPAEIHPEPLKARLDERRRGSFSPDYVSDLFTTARDVTAFASMVEEPDAEADRLRRAILYAEASQYIGDESTGRMWIDAVNAVTDPTFAALAPDTSRVLAFTSRTGQIPLRMGDPGGRVVQIRVELRSGRVDFFGVGARTVRLDRPHQVVTFDAEVKAAGRSTIEVYVFSPSGTELSRSVLVVSSTAINPIALIITIGAGLMLVGLWSRRLFRRRSP
jgi:hypothetical protein